MTDSTPTNLPDDARAIILVEGQSDRIALETTATRRRDDLTGVAVVATNGVHAYGRTIRQLLARTHVPRLAGLLDAGEADDVRTALTGTGLLEPGQPLADAGLMTCDRDLEDELIRALTPDGAIGVIDAAGDLRSFRTMQSQPQWRDRPSSEQLRRFIGAGARRKLRYAQAFVNALPIDQIPAPLRRVLDIACA